MKAAFKTRIAKSFNATRVIMALIPLAFLVAGCSGTLQTRGETPDDTYFRWKPQMETLPIEVHGGIQQLTADDIAKKIPYGTTPRPYNSAIDGQEKLAAIPRIVLFVGSEQDPTHETYCDTPPIVQPETTRDTEIQVVAAFCDGPRLVDLTTRDVQSVSIQNDGIVSIMRSMKRRLLDGLNKNDEVNPAEYGNEWKSLSFSSDDGSHP